MRDIPRWQHQYLGIESVPRNIGPLEFNAFFAFSPRVLKAIKSLRGPHLRLGAALQLGFLRMTGRTLDAVDLVPTSLLKYLGAQLDIPTPDIASLRAIYRKRIRTLYTHQAWALDVLRFERATERQLRHLLPYLRTEASHLISVDGLVELGKVWLYRHQYVFPGDRPIRDIARRALVEIDEALLHLIGACVTPADRKKWDTALLEQRSGSGMTHLEWLQRPPRKASVPSLRERRDRIDFLTKLGVDKLDFKGIPNERLDAYAAELYQLRPSKYRQLKEPGRTLKLACFLKLALMQTTDTAIQMHRNMVAQEMRHAQEKAAGLEAQAALSIRNALLEIFDLAVDGSVTDKDFRARVIELEGKTERPQFTSRAAAARWILSEPNPRLRALLNEIAKLDLQADPAEPTLEGLKQLRTFYQQKVTELPGGLKVPHSRAWSDLIEGADRKRALHALEADTAMRLRRALRSGAVWCGNSEVFRSKEELLISKERWAKERVTRAHMLNQPLEPEALLSKMQQTLDLKLQSLDAAAAAGEFTIDDQGIHLHPVRAKPEKLDVSKLSEALFSQIPVVQFPHLIVEVDSHTGLSSQLLGRPARSDLELLQLYGGMLAHGTAMDATAVALMIPQLTANHVLAGMQLFENRVAIRAANDVVVSYMRQLPVASLWGDGSFASSDMMSVEVSRQVWAARLDPRRRTASLGTYTHLTDFWALCYDQPFVLNERQVGPAIDGVLQQNEFRIERLAIDTHGYTEFGMSLGKHLGLDLCPRLKQQKERKLYLPRRMAYPERLERIVDPCISIAMIRKYWDELLRIAASVSTGHVTATIALARFGSAAAENPVYRAGVHYGRLVRSLYLADYFLSEPLRRAVNRILAHGEAVHTLQRAIYQGTFSKPRGRREEEQVAMSGSLTLMANLCLCWTTLQLQRLITKESEGTKSLRNYEWLKMTSPAQHKNINFRGTFDFDLKALRQRYADEHRKAVGR